MGKFKRGGVWYFRKQINRKAYVISTGFRDAKLADRACNEIEQEVRAGVWGWRKRAPLFEVWAEEFLEDHVPQNSPHTVECYTRAVHVAEASFRGRRISEISREELRGHLKKMTPSVRALHGGVLRRFWNAAIEEKKVQENPLKGVKLNRTKPRERVLSKDEEAQVLPALSPLWAKFFQIGLGTGLRVSEMLALTPASLDGQLLRVVGKGQKKRVVPLVGEAKAAFVERCAEVDGGWLFPYTRETVGRHFLAVAARLKLVPFSPHTLRHTYATRMSLLVLPTVLQKLMGHSGIGTTMRYYVHLGELDVLEAVTKAVTTGAKVD